jgi:hypothetical protein
LKNSIKVRSILILTFLFLSNLTFAQSDSTQIKLENYKKWFESGLITQDEYSDLKKNLLKVSPSNTIQNKDSVKRKNSAYKGQIKAGVIFTIVGLSAFIGSNPYLNNAVKSTPIDKDYAQKIDAINQNYKVLRGAGIGFGLLGLGLIAIGVSTKQAKLANGNSVLIDIPNFLIAYKF